MDRSEAAMDAMHWAFNETTAVKELNRQLNEGLVSSVEHANAVLSAWAEFQQLPQYSR